MAMDTYTVRTSNLRYDYELLIAQCHDIDTT